MGIPCVDPCVDGCLQSLAQDAYGFVKKRWLILYHFKKNFADLEEQKKELEKQRRDVQEQIERANYKGEETKKQVLEWMDDKEIKEFNDLMHSKTERQSITCFNFSFPNCISRYQLSKRAEKEITALLKKMDDGKKFTTVSNQGRTPKELQFPPEIGEFKVFESREVVLKDVKDALKEFNVVGIHGTGGVGKTTMAAEVAKQLLNEDRIDEFVMAVVSRDPDVKMIQGKLASSLQIQLDENESEQKRTTKLWNRLNNGKRNLVILDDVWHKINLNKIGIPVSVENNKCKLLITSRLPQEVWKDTNWDSKLLVKQIRVKELEHEEAWALFKNHAGDSIETSEVRSIANEICKKCGGLPIAIRAVGQALSDKDLYGWKDALVKLENYEMERIFDIDDKLFSSLKLSYEMLSDKEAQRCFLLCCLFPDDYEIPVEELVLHCQAAGFVGTVKVEETRNRVNTLVSILKSRCLLLDVPVRWDDDEVKVKVHDVIRDIGVAISKRGNELLQLMHGFRGGGEEEGEPSSSSSFEGKIKRKPYIAMWLRKSDFDFDFDFEDDHSFPGDVGTLVLDWYSSSDEYDHKLLLRANKFLCWKILSLKVLVLKGLNISSVFPPSSSGGESLANLRLLWLDTWEPYDAAVLRHLRKLKVFRLSHCVAMAELPAEIGLLTELLVLDLKYMKRLRKIPNGVLSKLPRLEELHLPLDFTGRENGGNESGRSENALQKKIGDENFTVAFKSREGLLNEIKNALEENNVVGIHGAGGVGKTAMATEVAKQLQSEGCIHEVAMAVVSLDPDVKWIQGKLASCLKDFKLDEMENKEERANKLWNRLKNGKSNLVILDDLWGNINLREIGIPVSGGNNDCKLLITSRQPQAVWNYTIWDSKLHVKLIRIEQLKDKEAWELFKNHAGDSIESSELRLIASQVCKKCVGLPVAIRAVGEALNGKDRDEWNDALTKLEKSRMGRILGIDEELFWPLKLSYEMLKSEEERKCFLLCCLFPDDAEISIEELVMHCKAARFVEEDTMEETRCRVHTLIKQLKERCLLLDVADEENSVKVHYVIRDVGVSISIGGKEPLQLMHGFRGGGEEGEPSPSSSSEGKIKRKPYIAMWLRKSDFEDDHSFPGDVGTLVLDWYGSSIEDDHTLLLRVNKFLCGKILSLKVLVLKGLNISSVFPPSSSGGDSLANLHMLWLDTWKADDAALLRHLQKLKVFPLTNLGVVELPAEIGLLTELLVLDLKNLRGLRKIPSGVLSKLTRLEELHLPLDFRKWRNSSLFSELSCLKRLTTLSACFPNCDLPWADDVFFGKLDRFDISVGCIVYGYTTVFTKGLKLAGVSVTNKFNGLICKADLLWFVRVNGLRRSLLVTKHGFPYLKKLRIEGCHDLTYVFTEPCARALPQLRCLEVGNCESLVSIVGGIEEEISEQDQGGDIIYFGRLEELDLTDLPNLVGFHSWVKNRATSVFFSDKIVYPALEALYLRNIPQATEALKSRILPQLIGQETKEIREHGNDFQGVSLPSLTFLNIHDENIRMPEVISFTPAEHGITAVINATEKEGVDKRMFQPLFDAVLGFGCA